MRFGFGFFSRSDLARDATGFDAPSADVRRFIWMSDQFLVTFLVTKNGTICEMALAL
jgi:hypothetical protein